MTRTRTPPDLKWVLNERAAVAGELQSIEAELARLTARKEQLGALLHHLDHVYSQLAPQAPAVPVLVVSARKRYGGRGNCIGWVRETLQTAYPQAVDTSTLTEAARVAFGLTFANVEQRERFRNNSLRTALRKLLALDEAERLHDFKGVPHLAGVWRWKPKEATFQELSAQVETAEVDAWP
jgi:hypothetical protein